MPVRLICTRIVIKKEFSHPCQKSSTAEENFTIDATSYTCVEYTYTYVCSLICHIFHCLALSLIVFTLGVLTMKRWGTTSASPTRIHYSSSKFLYVQPTFSIRFLPFLADFPHFSYSPCWKRNRETHIHPFTSFSLLQDRIQVHLIYSFLRDYLL